METGDIVYISLCSYCGIIIIACLFVALGARYNKEILEKIGTSIFFIFCCPCAASCWLGMMCSDALEYISRYGLTLRSSLIHNRRSSTRYIVPITIEVKHKPSPLPKIVVIIEQPGEEIVIGLKQ